VRESVQESAAESQGEQTESVGWWQPTPTAQLWDLEPPDDAAQANGGPRLRAVTPDEPVQNAGPTAAERARATWGAPELAPAPPEHWTQREITLEELEAEQGTTVADVPTVQASEPTSSWTLKLAPSPSETTEAAGGAQPTEGWSDVSFTEQPRFAPTPKEDVQPGVPAADADLSDDPEVQAADAAEVAAQLQPDWGSQAGEQQEQQSSDQPSWGVEAGEEEDLQTPDHPTAPLWTMPEADDATQEQPVPVHLWGDQPTQQQPEHTQNWDAGQAEQSHGWGADQAWGPQPNAETQNWPHNGLQNGQLAGDQQWDGQQIGGQQGVVQQAWGEQQAPRAWGEDENEAWGGQTDLSTGVGNKKPKSSGGGGGRSGAKLPLFVGGGVALVLLIVLAVVLITGGGDDKKADPNPTGTPTQSTGTPTNQSTTKPGQSKNPKLHEGIGRISSDAISFPRRNPPWSDRKRLVQQLLDSSGQHIVLQENVNGADDWTADIFVGGLGTGSGFNGDPKATAATLSGQLRTSMYGSIPATYRTVANGAVKRTNKSGWFYQQTVTAKSAAVTDRVLTLTVAVFDLGDGTAVAYISGIPNNRPDLKAAESQAYKGINVG
jgi:hypothetical protein